MTELEPWKIWAVTGALVAAIFGTTTVRLRLAGGASSTDESVFAAVNPPLSPSNSGSIEPNHPQGDYDVYAAAYTAMPIRRSGNSIPAAIAGSPRIHSLSVSITEGEVSGLDEPGEAPTTDVGRDLAESETMPELRGAYQPFTGESTLVAMQNVDLSDIVQVDFDIVPQSVTVTYDVPTNVATNTAQLDGFVLDDISMAQIGDTIAMNPSDYYQQSNDVALNDLASGRPQSDYTLSLNTAIARVNGSPNVDPTAIINAVRGGSASDLSLALKQAVVTNGAYPVYQGGAYPVNGNGAGFDYSSPAAAAQQLNYLSEANANYAEARVQDNLGRYYNQAMQQAQQEQPIQLQASNSTGFIAARNLQTLRGYNENYW